MKPIVVYYSLEGHTKALCEQVVDRLGADALELECAKPYPTEGRAKYLRSSRDVILGVRPKLAPYAFDATAHDLVVLAAPCWVARPAAPLATFLRDNDLSGLRRAAIITCKAAGSAEKYAEAMRSACGLSPADPALGVSEGQLTDPAVTNEVLTRFCEACRQR